MDWNSYFDKSQIPQACVVDGLGVIHLDQELTNYSYRAKFGPLPVLVNKVLLEHSHIQLFIYCLWLLLHYSSRMEWLQNRPSGLQAKNLYKPEESILPPAVDYCFCKERDCIFRYLKLSVSWTYK